MIYNKEELLNVDKIRIGTDSYPEKMLMDPNGGHWDIFGEKEAFLSDGGKIYGRDPRKDIKAGVVGIDFGTKSTIVVFQESNDKSMPMRISGGSYNKSVESSDYENPTVVQFRDVENFYKDYTLAIGRPKTKWEDMTVAVTAYDALKDGSSDDFYSVLLDLKQWCGNKKESINMRDQIKNRDITLKPFLDLKEEDIDPIEIYAYYIGSYINNMHTQGIYLEYFLSFPVTYETEIKNKIAESFKKGIKKSLPAIIQEDEEVMKNFKVTLGASEPAAYSICALEEFGFEPEGEEKVFYGVFDFGGGTTDFDFGVWEDANERRHDYKITHFGSGGDRYLGGENILSYLAYEVFKANQEEMRSANCAFSRPMGCERFPGDEALVNNSQEAKLNIRQLMEKLRPFWERHENYEKIYENEVVKVTLFNKKGEQKTGVTLDIDTNKLNDIIYSKIDVGVKNFFTSLKNAMSQNQETSNINQVKIFLAGNSSKSNFVKEIFEKYIVEEEKKVKEKLKEEGIYELFPPLGTEEAYLKQEERGVNPRRNDITKPTGKTGVAYGLLNSRKGGKIKVINKEEIENDNEIKFQYFVGYAKKRKLKIQLDANDGYNIWKDLIEADEDMFEVYYTSLPEAIQGQMSTEDERVGKKRVQLDVTDDSALVYIRAVAADTIEYVVATESGIKDEKYLSTPKRLTLD